jgi:CDP-diacylglycerol--glycerol-3-phosphate 3-phosphatidyltransferase
VQHQATNKEPKTFTDILRTTFKSYAEVIAVFLNRLGLRPNTVTFLGLLGHFVAAYLVIRGNITAGGIVLLFLAPLDFLDGTLARLRGESSRFGAFIDSVTDRYSEFVILGSLLVYYLNQGNSLGSILVYLTAAGSILVSYIRARAESLEFEARVGFLSRVERYIILIPCLIFNLPIYGLWFLAIFTNFTALQRIVHVRQQAYQAGSEGE